MKHRAGSLSDTVAAEEKISERRNELYGLEKRWRKLESRIEYTLVEIQFSERYQAHLVKVGRNHCGAQVNAFIEGLESAILSFGTGLSFVLRYGLALFAWIGILYWPARRLWRQYRRAQSLGATAGA